MTDKVAIVSCESYDPVRIQNSLKELLLKVDGLSSIRSGMRVAIKANLVAAGTPESAITTHPVVLAALTELLIERGATVVVGDSAGGPWMLSHMNHIYNVSGMHAIEEAGGELNRDMTEADAENPNGVKAKSFRYTAWLDSCDCMINVCKLKSHGMMTLSNAVKNLFGTVPGILKPEYHYRYPNPNDFADMIVDICEYWKPVLHICDAVIAMEGNGPTQGRPYPMNALLASKNPHALDWVAAKMIGADSEDIPTLQAAKRRGLLPDRFEEIPIDGNWQKDTARDFDRIINRNSTLFSENDTVFGKIKRGFLTFALGAKPMVTKKECIGCGKCAKICPENAITMQSGLPIIDRKKCILCFCCQEFCPKGAMKSHRSPIARMINH